MKSITVANGASVHSKARLGEGVQVGPGAMIGEHVTIGARTVVGPGAMIDGWTTIGEDNQIGPYAIIGFPPQHKAYAGERSYTVLGDRNVIREFFTVHRAWGEDQQTVIGHDNYFMVGSHVAHNCLVGHGVTFTNGAAIAGHVEVGDAAVLGAYVAVVQWRRIGRMTMVGILSKVAKDIPPFMLSDGNPLRVAGINRVGLERNGVSLESRRALKETYKIFYRSALLTEEALQKIEHEQGSYQEVRQFLDFVRGPSKAGVYRNPS